MKPLIVANWKCNPKTLKEAKELFASIQKGAKEVKGAEIVICPPFIFLSFLKPSGSLQLGSQDCFCEEKGAFTGEVSPAMLRDANCSYVILGHSERRKYQKETDEEINKKIKAVLKEGLTPILCIDQISQIEKDIEGVAELDKVVIAYEPLFAIGTGKACDWQKAQEMRLAIQQILKKNRIIYGGSVSSQNIQDYTKKAGFGGALVGGASLNPQEFLLIAAGV